MDKLALAQTLTGLPAVVRRQRVPYTRRLSLRGSRTDAKQRGAEVCAVVARGGGPAGRGCRRGVLAKHFAGAPGGEEGASGRAVDRRAAFERVFVFQSRWAKDNLH